jgi:sugar phosphate isomerase/epimerase
MSHNRRSFIRNTGLIATGVAMGALSCKSSGSKTSGTSNTDSTATTGTAGTAQPLAAFGIQLYTLRDDLPKDPKGIIKQLAGFGYKQIESFEGSQGMFWGMSNTDFKKYLDDLGMTIVSSHCNVTQDLERKAAEAAAIGMKYLIAPYIGAQKSLDEYKAYAERFNGYGEVCRKNGIRFAYHNHGYTFEPLEGQMPQDVLMQNTNPDTVDYQMDIYWVVTPGADPIQWVKKYPNRFRLCHVKDRLKTAAPKEENASSDLGAGTINFPEILKVARENGMEYFIVEQERYDNSTPIKSAQVDAEYMRTLRV